MPHVDIFSRAEGIHGTGVGNTYFASRTSFKSTTYEAVENGAALPFLGQLDLNDYRGVNWGEVYRITRTSLHLYLDYRVMQDMKKRIKSGDEYLQLNTFTVGVRTTP